MEWNQIKDKTKKVGPLKNLLQCKIKIKNSKEAYKNVKVKKKNGSEACLNFLHIMNLRTNQPQIRLTTNKAKRDI